MHVFREGAKRTVLAVVNRGASDVAAMAAVPACQDALRAEMQVPNERGPVCGVEAAARGGRAGVWWAERGQVC
jgi:hypothetical protein